MVNGSMNEKTIILSNAIRKDLEAIANIYTALARHPLPQGEMTAAKDDELIVIAYHLHHLYTAFENIFQNIAAMFENSVDDMGRWHAQLLERMRLDALPLRPKVIDDAAYTSLDELRRFRHLFRHAYSLQLDAERLELVWRRAMRLQSIYAEQLTKFIEFLETIE